MFFSLLGGVFFLLVSPALAQLQPPASGKISFVKDVQPILTARCAACHTGNKPQAGLSLHTRAEILKGGQSGPAVIPGNSKDSLLMHRVAGLNVPVMPPTGDKLTPEQLGILRTWIDQGAAWDAGPIVEQRIPLLAPRRPPLPKDLKANPLDFLVESYFRRNKISFPALVPDGVFVRRAYLDLWGLLPGPEESHAFITDSRADKRERLIDHLLGDNIRYTEHWISFWNDLLRNDEGVNYHGGRQSISPWLRKALQDNMPYDRFVSSLLNPLRPEDPAGYLIGVNWRGDVNASQTPPMQAAQNSSQVFLGVNLKCASCHDSFVSRWKLRDSYGMATFFSEEEMDLFRCDVNIGEKAVPKFLFPELGAIEPGATAAERRATAARLFTMPENGRFSRTLVNRVWKRLMGRAFVEPPDEMDSESWDADVMDWLASDFVDHQYDLRFLLRRIMTSRTYQMPAAIAASKEEKTYVFRGPMLRRLTAEQFVDAVSTVTGEWRVLESRQSPGGVYSRDWQLKSSALTRALGRPIRDQVFTERSVEPGTLQALELVNGETISNLLHRGAKRILNELQPPPENLFDSGVVSSNKAQVDVNIAGARQLWLLLRDVDSYNQNRVVAGWADAELAGPQGSVKLADLKTTAKTLVRPMQIKGQPEMQGVTAAVPSTLVYDIGGKGYTRFKAVVGVDEGSLQSDISPKVRFFVFTQEPDSGQLVRVTGDPPAPRRTPNLQTDALIADLYQYLFARDPNADEARLARQYLAKAEHPGKVSSDGLEDLLWILFLSPEFQYIQ